MWCWNQHVSVKFLPLVISDALFCCLPEFIITICLMLRNSLIGRSFEDNNIYMPLSCIEFCCTPWSFTIVMSQTHCVFQPFNHCVLHDMSPNLCLDWKQTKILHVWKWNDFSRVYGNVYRLVRDLQDWRQICATVGVKSYSLRHQVITSKGKRNVSKCLYAFPTNIFITKQTHTSEDGQNVLVFQVEMEKKNN